MKRWTLFHSCGLLLLLILPLIAGCDQQQAKSAPVSDAVAGASTNQPPPDAALSNAGQSVAGSANQDLSDAPGTVISTPAAAPNTSNNPQLGEVVKLAQAGVGETILMAYVTNSPSAFNLSSDDVVYLNDLGVPEIVVNAMLQRDQYFNSAAPAPLPAAEPTPPPSTQPTPPPTMTEIPSTDQSTSAPVLETPSADTAVTPPLTPPEDVAADASATQNGSYTYFYDSLAPYGNWIDIDGYGPCWQPTVVAANPSWQPYCDAGNWAYTDCGWCWVSNYSWGWAPFHYGRWFRNARWGWCWAPDVVWGPAWVSWRYNAGYCGWAPLPPAACYRPGFGFTFFGQSVGFNFGFGLSPDFFVFVPLDRFNDRFPSRSRLTHREVTKIYNTTVINNKIIHVNNNTIINTGVPVDRVAAATHTEIRPIHIRADAEEPGSARFGRDGRTLAVYRPALPTPKPTGNPRLAGEGVPPASNFDLRSRIERTSASVAGGEQQRSPATEAAPSAPERRPIISNPAEIAPRDLAPSARPASPTWYQGRNDNSVRNDAPNMNRTPVLQPQTPAPTLPGEGNRRTYVRPAPSQGYQPRYAAPQWQQRELLQQPGAQAPREGYPPRQDKQPRQEVTPRQDYQPRQEAPAGNYEQPRSYESHSAPPAQSAPSHQDSGQTGNGNANGNSGGGNGGGGGGRGH